MAIRGLRYQELTMLRKFMIDPLETESTAADEDENAQADQNAGNNTCSQRSRTSAIGGRVATNFASRTCHPYLSI